MLGCGVQRERERERAAAGFVGVLVLFWRERTRERRKSAVVSDLAKFGRSDKVGRWVVVVDTWMWRRSYCDRVETELRGSKSSLVCERETHPHKGRGA